MISELIKKQLLKEGHLYPSEQGVYRISQMPWCARKIFLDVTDPTTEEEPKLGPNTTGEAIHQLIFKILRKTRELINGEGEVEIINYYYEEEKGVKRKVVFNFIGHYDLLMMKDNRLIVVDIKTIKNLYYVRANAKEEHLNQLVLYQHALKKKFSAEVDGLIIYIERESFEMIEHYSAYDEQRFFSMSLKGIELDKAIRGKQLMTHAKRTPDWECDYCKHYKAEKCFKTTKIKGEK